MKAQQAQPARPTTLKVKVVRAFQDHERKVQVPGATPELPYVFAREMMAANKVVAFTEDVAPASTAPAPAPTAEESKAAAGAASKKGGK